MSGNQMTDEDATKSRKPTSQPSNGRMLKPAMGTQTSEFDMHNNIASFSGSQALGDKTQSFIQKQNPE